MKVPFLDLRPQHAVTREAVQAAVAAVFETQAFVLGPAVEDLERRIAATCGSKFGVGVSSGTDALLAALLACGIGPGDEVVTTPFTFVATAEAIARTGAKPVFADIDPATFQIDPARIERAVTPKTRAIVPVHLFGRCAEMDPIIALARKRNLRIIEDAAQALGARFGTRSAGSMGDAGCFSFYPSKTLGAAGDAGMVVTNDAALAERLRELRVHGTDPAGLRRQLGGNFRLDAVQAAVLGAKLPHVERWIAARTAIAARLSEGLRGAHGVTPPSAPDNGRGTWNPYVVRLAGGRRDATAARLREDGVETAVYYPRPLHLEPCFGSLGHRPGDFPHAEAASEEALALPCWPGMTDAQIGHVVEAMTRAAG